MILSALAQLWPFGEAEDGLAKHQPDQRPLPTSLRSSGVPLWAAFSAWHSTPTNVGRHGTVCSGSAHRPPHIPTVRWGPLWAAFSAWHSTPNQCGGSTGTTPHTGPSASLPSSRGTNVEGAPALHAGPPHPYSPVGGPYGRRSAPGIPRQTNAGRGTPAPYTCLPRPYFQWGALMGGVQRLAFNANKRGKAWHRTTRIPVGCTSNSPPHLQWGSVFPYPTRRWGPPRGVPRGERLAHAPVESTSDSPTHRPVGKRTPLPHALVGAPLGEYRKGRAPSHVPVGSTGHSPPCGLARLRLAASLRSRTYPSPSDAQAA